MPAPRFWVSEARATAVIKMMWEGKDPTDGMIPEKRKMYREIFNRVKRLHEEEPATLLGDLVFRIVNEEAPSSYISWLSVKEIVNERRGKKWK